MRYATYSKGRSVFATSLRLASALVITVIAFADTATSQVHDERAARQARMEHLFQVEERIYATRPYRREKPLRTMNIADAEVKEIRSVVATVVPDSIVFISGVVTGCPCEDGTACTDQVWVEARYPTTGRGLLLSKINDQWTVGPVQRWWLDYEAFEARMPRHPSLADFDAEDDLKLQFPACLIKAKARANG